MLEKHVLAHFTRRETETLVLVVEGLGNPAIAIALGISVSTVKVHVRHLFLGAMVSTRTELAVWAIRHPRVLIDGVYSLHQIPVNPPRGE